MSGLRNFDYGVVGVVVAVLLIGLAVAVTVMIKTVYVPTWVEQREAAHMEEVSNQFIQLKCVLDIQSLMEQKTAVSSPITLGNEEIPVFGLGKTFDSLEILPGECNISIQNATGKFFSFSVGSIKYSSGNSYFVDQDFIYEAGAVILCQYPRNMLIGKPSFVVTNYTNLSFTIVNVSGVNGKMFISGHGTYPLHSVYVSSDNVGVVDNVTEIRVESAYLNSWCMAFNSTLAESNCGLDYEIKDDGEAVIVNFDLDNDGYPDVENHLYLRIVKIFIQVTPGWVE
ncbi:MAG TPA: hypothetical protein ENI42_02085 [Thermoplasmatales archaeon]|nr:hypothetical protein [Thermoplasmatales archaeon]